MATAAARVGSSTAKAFVQQVYTPLESSGRSIPNINGITCYRLWVQGVVVAIATDQKQCTLDDGTNILHLDLKIFHKHVPPGVDARLELGDYIMAIGPMQKAKADSDVSIRTLLAHQIVKLNNKLQREPMWYLEVIEYWTSVVEPSTTALTV